MKIFLAITTILVSNLAFSQDVQTVFPKYNRTCKEFVAPCSLNKQKMCLKTVCDKNLNQALLNEFIKSFEVIGKQFNNPIELEEFLVKHIPLDLKKYKIYLVFENQTFNVYEFGIVVNITKDYQIKSITLS